MSGEKAEPTIVSTYVLRYNSPYEFDDDDGLGHEICWSQQSHEIRAISDEEAQQMAADFISDPRGVVDLGYDRGERSMISLSKLL